MIGIALYLVPILTSGAMHDGPERHLGDTVRSNVEAQTVNRNPDYGGRTAVANGQRATDAMIRYQTGKLKPLFKTNGKAEIGSQGGAEDGQSVSIPLVSSGSPN